MKTCPECKTLLLVRKSHGEDPMIPQEAGLYFAKSTDKHEWYDLIVNVDGTSPMLYISYVLDRGLDGPRLLQLKPHNISVWGKKIDEKGTV